MRKDDIASIASGYKPDRCVGQAQRLFTVIPGITSKQAHEEASKLMYCVRYLDHTGVMQGDQRMVAASHYITSMVRELFDQFEDERPTSGR